MASRRSNVTYIPALAVLLIVNGALLALYGVVSTTIVIAQLVESANHSDDIIAPIVFMVFTLAFLGVGIFQIVAGFEARMKRSRRTVIAALAAGLIGILGCYCSVTSIALFAWGLVLLLDKDVVRAFEESEEGP